MHTFLQDLRYGARQLLRQPGFTLVVLLALAFSARRLKFPLTRFCHD